MVDRKNIQYFSVAMTLLLIADSLTVFSGIKDFIEGKVSDISLIKSVYSNKNALAAVIFIKLPFALWLLIFKRRWFLRLGILGTFLAITATLFMSTRAFYVGTIVLSILLVLLFYLRFRQTRDIYQVKLAGIYLMVVLFSFATYSVTQRYFYPNKSSGYVVSVKERLSTISSSEGSAAARLNGWVRSWHVFKENPLLGVGLGNWKIATLKEENLTRHDGSIVLLKAHNDFIETTTETGIFGGILFILLFLLPAWVFARILFRKTYSDDWLVWLFLPTFGLFCYSVDAFFNFPQDRPEVVSLFAMYLGIIIALTSLFSHELTSQKPKNQGEQALLPKTFQPLPLLPYFSEQRLNKLNIVVHFPMKLAFAILISLSIYILILNFTASKLMRLVSTDELIGKYTYPANLFLHGFPAIPNLNHVSIPIDVDKARYLIGEKRYEEAIDLLKKSKANPFSEMVPYFITIAYARQNNPDSALVYHLKTYNLTPQKFGIVKNLCIGLYEKGRIDEAEIILNKYLDKNKKDVNAWILAYDIFNRNGNIDKAIAAADSAFYYFPTDTAVLKRKKAIGSKTNMVPFQQLYKYAIDALNAKEYDKAIQFYSEILSKEPGQIAARKYRAFCYNQNKEYAKSNVDLNLLIPDPEPDKNRYNLYNLRGINYWALGNREAARQNFQVAAEMGDKEGTTNLYKFDQTVNKK
jgi:O-antigen ligase/tetratricopeptide (TPR) repeat protein